jgi:hypothetical protein
LGRDVVGFLGREVRWSGSWFWITATRQAVAIDPAGFDPQMARVVAEKLLRSSLFFSESCCEIQPPSDKPPPITLPRKVMTSLTLQPLDRSPARSIHRHRFWAPALAVMHLPVSSNSRKPSPSNTCFTLMSGRPAGRRSFLTGYPSRTSPRQTSTFPLLVTSRVLILTLSLSRGRIPVFRFLLFGSAKGRSAEK